MAQTLPTRCCSCPTVVNPGDRWVIHHTPSRGEMAALGHPERMWDPDTWSVQCRRCSNRAAKRV